MDSTIFNRRTLLGSGALVGLGALLAACGQQANNEAAATASAAPSETASASAAASGSPSASATPSTVRGYSGGSKAPDGEYRKADWQGPAQNVPKPPVPEEGYREKSISGLEKTLRAWILHENYSIQTGDYTETLKFLSPSFTSEIDFYKKISSLYQRGGWVVAGTHNFIAHGLRAGRPIFGAPTASGLTLCMLSLTAAGKIMKIVKITTICGILNCATTETAGL